MGSHSYNQDQKPGLWSRVRGWLKKRERAYDKAEKARLCAPCANHCGNELCYKVGCLNMDMRTNSLRLHLLVNRLEGYGYKFPTQIEVTFEDSKPEEIPINTKTNVVKISDYRNDDESVD